MYPSFIKSDTDFFELYKFSRAEIFNKRNLTSGLKSDSAQIGYCSKSCSELNESSFGYDIKSSGKTVYNCQYLGGSVKVCPAVSNINLSYAYIH